MLTVVVWVLAIMGALLGGALVLAVALAVTDAESRWSDEDHR